MKQVVFLLFLLSCSLTLSAQREKMSSFVRRAAMEHKYSKKHNAPGKNLTICALVRIADGDGQVLTDEGCKLLARWGNIYAADIPICKLQAIASNDKVVRIEAGERSSQCLDTTAIVTKADLIRDVKSINNTNLRGHGVVMGIMDIGFDLTHPTFYSEDLAEYRIKAFWDMIDPDSLSSSLYVGRDYVTEDAILKKAHATDGLQETHGTHTAGIAAGSGKYMGMAPDADLCLVANAVSSDISFIPDEMLYKYTSVTDLLGFKYIFDYAEREGKPCVVSFSEGSHNDLSDDNLMLDEILSSLTGPGRIIVASAGNESIKLTYLNKPQGLDRVGAMLRSSGKTAHYTIGTDSDCSINLTFFKSITDRVSFHYSVNGITEHEDICLTDTLTVHDKRYVVSFYTYPSCYDNSITAIDFIIEGLDVGYIGENIRIGLELSGTNATTECFSSGGYFRKYDEYPDYADAEATHNIHFPASSPYVIAVGATGWRTGITNYLGDYKESDNGEYGIVAPYSSVGPTFSGMIKPDVVAPGCNVISAYSSYYLENNPDANDIKWDVEHFEGNGRTYAWNANTGTSMSAPVVGGIIALWLELCPTLTTEDILDVLAHTCQHYDASMAYPNTQYGYGEIDALAGAKYIMDNYCPVHEVRASDAKSAYYDLQGRRVGSNKAGIIITKGKKISLH